VARDPCQKGASVIPVVLALKRLPDREKLVPERLWKYFDDHMLVSGWYPERDYFALLGVTHAATGYEVRRAFLELRRAFDPSRVLTPEIVDLAEDVRKITVVLEEAYDILKDAARRDRYRRAIEAAPGG